MKPSRDPEQSVLIQLLCEGAPEAVELLLRRHGDRVRGYLQRRFPTLDAAEVHDIVVDAVLRLLETFDPQRGSPAGWLTFLAHREAINVLRQNRMALAAQNVYELETKASNQQTPLDEMLHRERLLQVQAAMAELSDLERAIIEADLDAGVPACAARLAVRLGTTEGSIYAARRRARKKLLARLAPSGR